MMRIDQGTQEYDDGNTQPGHMFIKSILDFGADRTYLRSDGVCVIYEPIAGYFLPYPAFLRDANARYGGKVASVNPFNFGECDTWIIYLGTTVITFYFDSNGLPVRYAFFLAELILISHSCND